MQFKFEFETDFGQVAFWHDDHDDMTFIRGRLLWCDAGDVTSSISTWCKELASMREKGKLNMLDDP